MSVTFMSANPAMASARYRALMPAEYLASRGIGPGNDVLVAAKHGWDWDTVTRGFKRVVFDVCADHFSGQHRAHYLKACDRADAIVAASEEMARVIYRHTGRTAWVIPDPYEERECEPRIGPHLLWHGHLANAREIAPWVAELSDHEWTLITGGGVMLPPGFEQWSLARMDAAFNECGLIVLPYIGHPESTANRAINAIRRGLFPVCGPLPALAEIGPWQGHIGDGVRWALANESLALRRVKDMQDYVRGRFSPDAVGDQWQRMLETI